MCHGELGGGECRGRPEAGTGIRKVGRREVQAGDQTELPESAGGVLLYRKHFIGAKLGGDKCFRGSVRICTP